MANQIGQYSFNRIRQFSFVVEYVYLAYMCILITRRFQPGCFDFGFYIPQILNIIIALVYGIVLYLYSGRKREPSRIELLLRFIYLFIAGRLITESNNPSIQIIIVLPTVIMALRYPLKYTVMTAMMTTIVLIIGADMHKTMEFDYIFIFISFIWVIGLLVNASMEVERRMQEERQKLQDKENLAAIGQMAAGIAHEVRNPLTVIKGFVQLLKRFNGTADEAVLKNYLEMIDKEIDRVSNLLKDFLQFAKPSKPKLVEFDLNQALNSVKALMETHCTTRGINMEMELDPQLPKTQCDGNQIKQVIINIALNAIDSMQNSRTKKLTLRTYYDPDFVYISIEDTGCGIPADQLSRIFVPFYTTKETGTGLGLSVCYSIIENHRGSIAIDSKVEKGTNFLISLPRTIISEE